MNNALKLIITLGIFVIPPFIVGRLLLSAKIDRQKFSSLCSLLAGTTLLLLVIMYVQFQTVAIGIFLFIIAFPVTFPVFYVLYPRLKKRVESRIKRD